ncbi:alkanesulfonate monooxygenase [Pseudoduganella lurida]|uniref:Alkanesulfonate monooxygenase n=1 Tax=Pseudoduganella lurida TaxID=1036180 RepID=A0A562QWB9_9BURK|nr:LLM class flavin-dependent oxidoreductase [Pseudoduganella lurida]TWI60624.1 alkanesulfonate monooxygenase [Pseudoduganella lurida]
MSIDFFSRLPMHGETRFLPGDDRSAADDSRYIDYLAESAKTIERAGFGGVLMVNAPIADEPWMVCSLLARETQHLRFVTAFQPFQVSPWTAVQMTATYQRATGNRMIWNIINGGSEIVQQQVGDFTPHDERYDRAMEFMDMARGFWTGPGFQYEGKYFRANGGGLAGPLAQAEMPLICTAGSSEAARELGAKHADYYLMRAERPHEMAELIADVRQRARAYGREHAIRFGMSVDVITRETDEAARAEANRIFTEAVARGAAKAGATSAGRRSARKLGFEHEFKREEERERSYDEFFIYPNVWSGIGYFGIPPGCALVGSYEDVVARIREYHDVGIDLFFLAGYPHLQEVDRIGTHILPYFSAERAPAGIQT